jgi:membrane dipeptidase
VIDGHLDIAWNALSFRRGFDGEPAKTHLVSRNALDRAGVDLVFATLFAEPEPGAHGLHYETPREAHHLALTQLNYYRSLERLTIVDKAGDLGKAGLKAVILMEGADPIESPDQLGDWHARGVRIIGPAWSRTRYSGGTGAPGGLTEAGRELLRQMETRAMILDLSHMADEAVEEALAVYRGPIIASHSNARALVPGDRQLTDETARQIAVRDGVMGISFFARHLRVDGKKPTLDDAVRHVRHLASVTSPDHVALGTDLDGGFDRSAAPVSRYEDLKKLDAKLARHFTKRQVEGILGGNWRAFLRRALPKR